MFATNRPKDVFTEGFNSLLGGILLTGLSLLILGILIFMFPELIDVLAAALILTLGIIVLYGAWQIWRFKKHVLEIKSDSGSEPVVYEVRGEGPNYTWRRITMIMR